MAGISSESVISKWYRPGVPCPRFDSLETEAEARKEDDERVRRLGWPGSKSLLEQRQCQDLIKRLSVVRTIAETLASKRYMRVSRANLTMKLKRLLDEVSGEPVYLVTLISAGLAYTAEELKNIDSTVLIQRLRMMLGRCGANPGVAGWAFGYLDGEYNPATGMIQLHWHLIVPGDLVAAFERLKDRTAFRSVGKSSNSPDGVAKRVYIEKIDDPQKHPIPPAHQLHIEG